jgi:hypothetical protein
MDQPLECQLGCVSGSRRAGSRIAFPGRNDPGAGTPLCRVRVSTSSCGFPACAAFLRKEDGPYAWNRLSVGPSFPGSRDTDNSASQPGCVSRVRPSGPLLPRASAGGELS